MGYRSPRLYSLHFSGELTDPTDSSVFYIGNFGGSTIDNVYANCVVKTPIAGHIRAIVVQLLCIDVVGSAEQQSFYIRVNDTVDYLIAIAANTNVIRNFVNGNLNIPVAYHDSIVLKWVTPAWVTNPSGCHVGAEVIIEAE